MSEEFMVIVIVSSVFSFVGAVFLLVGILMHRSIARKKRVCSACTIGTVTDLVKVRRTIKTGNGRRAATFWHPVFQYEVNFRQLTKQSPIGGARPFFKIGQKVTVYYNPANVEEYYVAEDKGGGLIEIIFGGLGAVLFVVGVGVAAAFLLL